MLDRSCRCCTCTGARSELTCVTVTNRTSFHAMHQRMSCAWLIFLKIWNLASRDDRLLFLSAYTYVWLQ